MSQTNKSDTTNIKPLTEEQKALMPEVREQWIKIALDTNEANREEAERGILMSYKASNNPPPSFGFIWVNSPLKGAILQAVLVSLCTDKNGKVSSLTEEKKVTGIEIADTIFNKIIDAIHNNKELDVKSYIPKKMYENVKKNFWEWSNRSCWGQNDASWLAFYYFFLEKVNVEMIEPLRGQMITAQSAGSWWPFDDVCIVANRPNIISRDEGNRLHSLNGPAISYRDGFAIWASHGVRVPKYVIENPEQITVVDIEQEANAEIRRVKMEQFGYKRYMNERQAELLDRSDYGALWKIDVPNDEPIVMVEVINSTEEPDGTKKQYLLRVPPNIVRARDAVAWTFGLDGEKYTPQIET